MLGFVPSIFTAELTETRLCDRHIRCVWIKIIFSCLFKIIFQYLSGGLPLAMILSQLIHLTTYFHTVHLNFILPCPCS
jgi:hypothetical protein